MSKLNPKINFVQILLSIMLSELRVYNYLMEIMKPIGQFLKYIKQYFYIKIDICVLARLFSYNYFVCFDSKWTNQFMIHQQPPVPIAS